MIPGPLSKTVPGKQVVSMNRPIIDGFEIALRPRKAVDECWWKQQSIWRQIGWRRLAARNQVLDIDQVRRGHWCPVPGHVRANDTTEQESTIPQMHSEDVAIDRLLSTRTP
jgi:hypothetical protein